MYTFDRKKSEHRNSPRFKMQSKGDLARNKAISNLPDLLHKIGNQAAGRLLRAYMNGQATLPVSRKLNTALHVLSRHAAPHDTILRSPFDSETREERARRERLIQSIGNAIGHIRDLLSSGGLLQDAEVPVERGGVRGIIYGAHTAGTAQEVFVSYTDRDTRLRQLVRRLMAMATLYRTRPISAEFSAPAQTDTGEYQSTVPYTGGSIQFGGSTAEWADLQAAYERYCMSQRITHPDFDWIYIDPTRRIVPGAARGAPRISRGIQTGAYMVVPDIEREPLRYFRLDGFTPIPPGSTIVEFWHDDFGYYYMHRGQRIDVSNPWRI